MAANEINEQISPEATLIRRAWQEGRLRGLLLDHQFPLYDLFRSTNYRSVVFHISRRFGKSADMLVIMMEDCIRNNGWQGKYAAATGKDVTEIIHPLMNILTRSAPEDLKPYWVASKHRYFFPQAKESSVVVSGVEGERVDNLRGTSADLICIDECQNISNLDYVINDVLNPQTLTTGGRFILSGTTPKTPAHPFYRRIAKAKIQGSYIRRTIHDDSRPEVLQRIPEFMADSGGEMSSTWLREYLCEIVTDPTAALIPELTRPEVRDRMIQVVERPPHFVPYTVIDLGFVDYTGVVFGLVDFRSRRACVVDELLVNRMNTEEIARSIIAKEKQIWGTNERGEVLHKPRRYADADPRAIADFNVTHGLSVSKVNNDKPEVALNGLRLAIQRGEFIVDPKCVHTIDHLTSGVWDKNHKKFDRSDEYGHFDLVAASMYYVRVANLSENPYPDDYGHDAENTFFRDHKKNDYSDHAIMQAFRLNGGKRGR